MIICIMFINVKNKSILILIKVKIYLYMNLKVGFAYKDGWNGLEITYDFI